ncbi:uncharacterized protein PFB0145c-like [Melanaphis sacchari]|uniref:uncharacterized protein PFB0145c-like n=1 Tax=Melanaphis sacchari TaxID=742174 RepID=UPI000DC130B2|nr:uncharacterized protein PFB0145c-like [Melanaphis sacchari]XP_025195442.1 uncharacterized protein PFB0145c-like [Melanaphis sacchari]XP_025195443.1 uncharacterized protein PFB0145c-like [Melanaphis sacchari]
MMSNQTSSTDSAFKIPMAPQFYPSQSESLLFQDIIEEKAVALRNVLNDFLKVQPYRKFDIEFNSFLKRIKRIIIDGHRSGSNISRVTNSSQIAPLYARPSASFNYRPSTSFNYRPPTTVSMVSSSDYGTLRLPENNFQPIEPRELSNPFKPPDCLQPRVVLSRIDQSGHNSHESHSISATVIEVSQNHNETVKENNIHEVARKSKSLSRNEPTARNTYSDVTFDENNQNVTFNENNQNQNVDDDNNSIESLLEDVGFKIIVGLTENNETKKKNASQHSNNKSNVLGNVEKFLSMWSLNMKLIKSSQQSNISKHVLILTGNLLSEDKLTVVEKRHEAGILEGRKENNLVKTRNGLYRLVGNIIGGSPNELYQTCLSINGIPRTWRNIVKQLTGTENKTKNVFDFSISSPAGPITKPTRATMNLDASMTRKGTTYSKNITLVNHKRKLSEYDETENNKIKHRKFGEHLPLLLASTPKKPKKQPTMFETPSQILKNKFSQNILNKQRKLNNVNDSIHINKKRKSQSKEQTSKFLKPKTPEKTLLSSNNSTKYAKQISRNSSVGSKNNTKLSNQSSKISNSSVSKSKSKTLENSSVSTRSLNNSKQQSKLKTSINSTNHSVEKSKENVKAIKQITPKMPKNKTVTKHVNVAKEIKKKKVSTSGSALTKTNNKCIKAIKPKAKICDESLNNTNTHQKLKANKSKTKQVHCPNGSSTGLDLFGCIDHGDFGNVSDYNVMASPGKLSVVLGNDKSRSVTPPLFNCQWSSTAKSLVASEPPTPLSKSMEAKALKRVKAPKITLEDEMKYNKKKNSKQSIDFKTVSNKINKMLEFGSGYDED